MSPVRPQQRQVDEAGVTWVHVKVGWQPGELLKAMAALAEAGIQCLDLEADGYRVVARLQSWQDRDNGDITQYFYAQYRKDPS